MSIQEYHNKFPDSPLRSPFSIETKDKMRQIKKKWWDGDNWTEEMSQRRSEIATKINTGRILSKDSRDKISKSLLGHKQSDETRFRKHKAKIGKNTGKDCPAYQGKNTNIYRGFTNYIKHQVLKRDNYTCQELNCPNASKNLSPHHLDFNKQNNDLCNLITLCRSCHITIHWLVRKGII